MRRLPILIVLIIASITLGACSSSAPYTNVEKLDPIIEVNKFSRITAAQLKEQLGEPVAEYDENWTVPSSGDIYPMKTYDYELNGYYTEFLVVEDAVVRMNIYASDNNENTFTIRNEHEMFALLNIQPRESVSKVKTSGDILYYMSVSDTIGSVWTSLEGDKASEIKITYNYKYFD